MGGACILSSKRSRKCSGSCACTSMQVHDELVFEVPNAELATVTAKVKELMEAVDKLGKLEVPLVVEVGVGENWDKAH